MLPLALAFRDAGHDVMVAVAPALAPRVVAAGLTAVPAGDDFPAWWQELTRRHPGQPWNGLAPERILHWFTPHLFAEVGAPAMLRDLRVITASWRPDLIVHESFEFAAPLPRRCVARGQCSTRCHHCRTARFSNSPPRPQHRCGLAAASARHRPTGCRAIHASLIRPARRDRCAGRSRGPLRARAVPQDRRATSPGCAAGSTGTPGGRRHRAATRRRAPGRGCRPRRGCWVLIPRNAGGHLTPGGGPSDPVTPNSPLGDGNRPGERVSAHRPAPAEKCTGPARRPVGPHRPTVLACLGIAFAVTPASSHDPPRGHAAPCKDEPRPRRTGPEIPQPAGPLLVRNAAHR
jgi:hypothetical protein